MVINHDGHDCPLSLFFFFFFFFFPFFSPFLPFFRHLSEHERSREGYYWYGWEFAESRRSTTVFFGLAFALPPGTRHPPAQPSPGGFRAHLDENPRFSAHCRPSSIDTSAWGGRGLWPSILGRGCSLGCYCFPVSLFPHTDDCKVNVDSYVYRGREYYRCSYYVPFDCSGVSFQLPDGCEHAVAVRPFAKRVFFFSFRTGNNGHREVLIWPLGGGSCQLGCMHACDV